jgi:chromate transporter
VAGGDTNARAAAPVGPDGSHAAASATAVGAIAGAVVVLARQTVTDVPTDAIAIICLGLLLWRKIPEPVFVELGGLAGILLHGL